MRVWGGLLPFIGFREELIDEQMRTFFDIPMEYTHINTFQLEWLGYGIVICTKPRTE
jgi:hypothetical protein